MDHLNEDVLEGFEYELSSSKTLLIILGKRCHE